VRSTRSNSMKVCQSEALLGEKIFQPSGQLFSSPMCLTCRQVPRQSLSCPASHGLPCRFTSSQVQEATVAEQVMLSHNPQPPHESVRLAHTVFPCTVIRKVSAYESP